MRHNSGHHLYSACSQKFSQKIQKIQKDVNNTWYCFETYHGKDSMDGIGDTIRNYCFNYCPLVWMLHSRSNNNKIKHLHERYLRIVYQDKQSSYENLLVKDGTVSMHHRNIQALAIEMCKIKKDLSTEILSNILTQRTQNHYSLRNASDFQIPFVRTVYHGTERISYLGPKIWDIVPAEIKNAISLNSFKAQIKKWLPINCPCRLCKPYINGVGFLEELN